MLCLFELALARSPSMKVVYKRVPSGNEIMEKFGGSNGKTAKVRGQQMSVRARGYLKKKRIY